MEYKPTLQVGETVLHGKYRIEGFVGRGRFTEVYRAVQGGTNDLYAIRVVGWNITGVSSRAFNACRNRFRLETQLAARLLNNPHITPVYGFEEHDARLFLITGYAPGGSLKDRLQGQPLPVTQAVQVALDVADALDALHHLGMVHANVKPSNILIGADGQAQITDLGLAQTMGSSPLSCSDGDENHFESSNPYMSPEQADPHTLLTPASDVYSLGCVLFEMLTGQAYQQAGSASGRQPRRLNPKIPRSLDRAVARMLSPDLPILPRHASDQTKRYRTMSDVRHALQAAIAKPDRADFRRLFIAGVVLAATAFCLATLIALLSVSSKRADAPTAAVSTTASLALPAAEASSAPVAPIPPIEILVPVLPPVAATPIAPVAPIPPIEILVPVLPPAAATPIAPAAPAPPIVLRPAVTAAPLSPTDAPSPAAPAAAQPAPTDSTAAVTIPPTPTARTATIVSAPTSATAQTPSSIEWPRQGQSHVYGIAFSPDGALLAEAAATGITVYDVQTRQSLWSTETQLPVYSIAFSPDGATLATGFYDGIIRLRRPGDGLPLFTLEGHTATVMQLAFSPDGKTLASACVDKTVRLWRTADGALLRILPGHTSWVSSVTFSPDGETLATGGGDNVVRLWRASDGALLNTLRGHTSWVSGLAFSLDGALAASASGDRTVRVWQASSGALLKTLEGLESWVSSVAFSPGGATLAVGCWDGAIKLWRVNDGVLLRTLVGHSNVVTETAFSADGDTLASSSWDGTIRLWRIN